MGRNNADFFSLVRGRKFMLPDENDPNERDSDYEFHLNYVPSPQFHQVSADFVNVLGKKIRMGELAWHKDTGEVKVAVHPTYQKKGLGTALWNYASELSTKGGFTQPSGAASHTRTDAGDAFLKKMDPNSGERKHRASSFGEEAFK